MSYYIVPAEIESQGKNAQRAYIKALSDGFVKVYRGRILVVGQAGAGKTCLKNNLLGLPFDPNQKSTDGIKVDPSKFEIDVDQVKNWQSTGNKNEQLLGCSEDIAKILIEKLPHEKDLKAIGCLLDEDLRKEKDLEELKREGNKRISHMNQVCLKQKIDIYLKQELELEIVMDVILLILLVPTCY